jgi:tetratricopeptide (TPR) repeat protein
MLRQTQRAVPRYLCWFKSGRRAGTPYCFCYANGMDMNPALAKQRAQLQQAAALYQRGRLAEAQAVYHEVLKTQPNHSDALHMLGVIAAQTRNPKNAVDLIGRAIEIDPNNALAHFNKGSALYQLRQLDAALASYNQAVAIKPNYADAYFSRGNVLHECGRLPAALASYNQAIALKADNAAAYFCRGIVLRELKELDAALASFDQAIASQADFADAHFHRAGLLCDFQRYEAAIASFDKAIQYKPDCSEAYFYRGVTLATLAEYQQALASYDRAIAIRADFAEAYCNRGNVLMQLQQFDAALASYNQAIAIKGNFALAYSNRGNVLKALNLLDAALASYNQAIEIKADYAEAYFNRGVVLNELNQPDAALASYDQAIALKADYAEPHFYRALVLLLTGDFKNGWIEYEWRWRDKYGTNILEKRDFTQPLWLGDAPIADRTILLHSEQGLGDTLQFCRYVRMVAALGARVVLEVQKPLVRLLANLEGVSCIVAKGGVLPAYDFQCPLLSLPLAFKTNIDSIPATTRYLGSETTKVAHWKARLGAKNKPRVGLMWSGNPKNTNLLKRSISLANWLPHLPADLQYVSLQKDVPVLDQQTLQENPAILNFADDLQDFSDTAALCECVDLVISIDTSVAHLSGGLGKKTWILLAFAADFRWLLKRTDCPWYPTVKLYRQRSLGAWDGVFEQVKADLIHTFK